MSQSEIQVSTTPPLPGTVLVEQINDAFNSVATQFSGSVDPAAYATAYMLWADTGTGNLKRRNAANNAWTVTGRIYPGIVEDSSGKVGIGTASPANKLSISGTAGVADLSSGIRVTNTSFTAGTYAGMLFQTADGLNSYVTAIRQASFGGILAFGTNDGSNPTSIVERMRLDSFDNLLVGTASSSFGQSGFIFAPNYTAAGNSGAAIQHINGSASGSTYISFVYNAGQIGSIAQNGTTSVLYNTTSDYRLKNDPQPLTGSKDFIMALQPKKWQWWDGSGESVGFIAHEFMEVAKHSGNGEKDAVDENGKPVYQSIQSSSSEVMANLIGLVQEQQALITQLQADVAALKGAA